MSGFTGSHGALLLDASGSCLLATDGRYLVQAAEEAADLECVEARAAANTLVERAVAGGVRRIGFEAHDVTVERLAGLGRSVGDVAALSPVGRPVEALRAAKDAGELERLRTACQITDAAFGAVIEVLRPGVTEREVSWQLTSAMRDNGAEGPAFDSIVAFGEHSAIPHHRPTDRPLRRGDLVKLDFGAKVDGYHADMTRTVVCGPPAGWQREIHDAVAGTQTMLRAATVVAAVPADLDAAMRESLTAQGHSAVHGLGHGVGLEIHEDPFLTQASTASPLAAGSVVTIEPGIYLPERGGVRIEDTLVVTADGPEVLTTSPRELVEVGP